MAFTRLKTVLASHPVVRNFNQPFHLQIDASRVGVGAVLQPDHSTCVLHPVAYYSAKLKPHQRGNSTIEKEALSLVSALQKFDCYLHLALLSIMVFSDHNPLAFIHSMKTKNQRILR